MVWIVSKCPHCKKIYNSGNATLAIGKPLLTCSKCRKGFVDESIMEWDLKTDREKSAYKFMLIYSSFAYSFGIIMFVAAGIFITDFNYVSWAGSFAVSGPFVLFFVSSFLLYKRYERRLMRDIQESQSRLDNQDYRSQLESVGLFDRVNHFNNSQRLKDDQKREQKALWEKNS